MQRSGRAFPRIGLLLSTLFACILGGCATPVSRVPAERSNWEEDQNFSRRHWKRFSPPQEVDKVQRLALFGTYYYTPSHRYVPDGVTILDLDGRSLGPKLASKDFCNAADEGAFRAPSSLGASRYASYTYAGAPALSHAQVRCAGFFQTKLNQFSRGEVAENWPNIVAGFERSRFRRSIAPYGNGGSTRWLVPWRTIATFNSQIPPGSVLYIPQVRGAKVALPSGHVVVHDGYFFAADSGGGIKTDHIDFFTGLIAPKPFLLPGIDGRSNRFDAYVVINDRVAAHFKGLHRME